MPCHELKYCPRCNTAFECKVGNVTECQCDGFIFNEAERDYMSQAYDDCLCRRCLSEIKHEIRVNEVHRTINKIISPLNKR